MATKTRNAGKTEVGKEFWLWEVDFVDEHDVPPTTGGLFTTKAAAKRGYREWLVEEAKDMETIGGGPVSPRSLARDYNVEFYTLTVNA